MHATTAPVAAIQSRPTRLIGRDFQLLWAGQAVSNLGDIIFDTTAALWIFTRFTHGASLAPLAISGALAAAALPDLLVGPFAGVFVDRLNKRRLLIRMDAMRAVLVALLAVLTGAVPLPWPTAPPLAWQLGELYAAVFLAAVCAQFFNPARMAMLGMIVPEPERARAAGLSQVTSSLSLILGPVLAAPIFFAIGPGPALIANAASFVVSMALISAIRRQEDPTVRAAQQSSFLVEFREGLRFFRSSPVLVTLLVSVMLVMLGGGCINALDIFFIGQNLHASTQLFGLLNTAAGCGLLLGAVLSSVYAERLGVARAYWISLLALGVLVLIYARLTSFAPAIVVIVLLGIPNAAVNVVIGPLLLRATPPHLVGRVAAVLQPAITFAMLASSAGAGLLASTVLHGFHTVIAGISVGPIDLIFTWTGLAVIAGGLYARANLHDER